MKAVVSRSMADPRQARMSRPLTSKMIRNADSHQLHQYPAMMSTGESHELVIYEPPNVFNVRKTSFENEVQTRSPTQQSQMRINHHMLNQKSGSALSQIEYTA